MPIDQCNSQTPSEKFLRVVDGGQHEKLTTGEVQTVSAYGVLRNKWDILTIPRVSRFRGHQRKGERKTIWAWVQGWPDRNSIFWTWQLLWLPSRDLPKTQSVNTVARRREGILRPPSVEDLLTADGCWEVGSHFPLTVCPLIGQAPVNGPHPWLYE